MVHRGRKFEKRKRWSDCKAQVTGNGSMWEKKNKSDANVMKDA
jgi:hypothetical protein